MIKNFLLIALLSISLFSKDNIELDEDKNRLAAEIGVKVIEVYSTVNGYIEN